MDDGTVLIWHLGMSGRVLSTTTARLSWTGMITLSSRPRTAVIRFNDQRRFGSMDLATEAGFQITGILPIWGRSRFPTFNVPHWPPP